MPKLLANALTPLQVKNGRAGRLSDGGGLQLLVKESGARSWVFRYMMKGRTRDIGLGPAAGLSPVSLSEAREQASELRRLVKSGVDPIDRRERDAAEAAAASQAAAIASITFRTAAEAYITAHEARWRNAKHRAQWTNTLEAYAFPLIGDLPVSDVGTEHVMSVLEPIWEAKPETASRVRGRIESILDGARARGHRQGENPARWRGHLAEVLPARTRLSRGHHKAMAYGDVPEFVGQLRDRQATAALALEFAILTAGRSGEVIGATWDEIDLQRAVWIIPAGRMKAAREHRVPLSPRAVEILEAVKELKGKHLFPGNGNGQLSVMAMTMLLRRMKVDATVHGFRSSFRDWAGETTAYPREVIEHALAHQLKDKAEAAYQRGDLLAKRTRLMADWATFCGTPAGKGASVTPIRAEAS